MSSTSAASRPDADKSLKPGDVVIFGIAHSGIVGDKGIDHFLQVKGAGGKEYLPKDLPPFMDGRLGGLHIGDTLAQVKKRGFLEFKEDPSGGASSQIVVYRKVK